MCGVGVYLHALLTLVISSHFHAPAVLSAEKAGSRSRTERVGEEKNPSPLWGTEPYPLRLKTRGVVTTVTQIYRLPFQKYFNYSLGLYSYYTELQYETGHRELTVSQKVNVRCGGTVSLNIFWPTHCWKNFGKTFDWGTILHCCETWWTQSSNSTLCRMEPKIRIYHLPSVSLGYWKCCIGCTYSTGPVTFCWLEVVEFNAGRWTEYMRLKCQWIQPSGCPVVGVWFITQWYFTAASSWWRLPCRPLHLQVIESLTPVIKHLFYANEYFFRQICGSHSSSRGTWNVRRVHRHWRAWQTNTRTL
jgi:hypothetical protein